MLFQQTNRTDIWTSLQKTKSQYGPTWAQLCYFFNEWIENAYMFKMASPSETLNKYKKCHSENSKLNDECCESFSICKLP